MTQVLFGNRFAAKGKLRVGCCAVIFDRRRARALLTRRADNGRWCVPGGAMQPSESAAEACAREVLEETGLRVRVTRLVGVYSDPDQLVIYPDGEKVHFVILSFEAEVLSGDLGLSPETTEVGYFSIADMESMPMHGHHKQRVEDALLNQSEALIK